MQTGGSSTRGRSSRQCLTCFASAMAGHTFGPLNLQFPSQMPFLCTSSQLNQSLFRFYIIMLCQLSTQLYIHPAMYLSTLQLYFCEAISNTDSIYPAIIQLFNLFSFISIQLSIIQAIYYRYTWLFIYPNWISNQFEIVTQLSEWMQGVLRPIILFSCPEQLNRNHCPLVCL